MPRLFEPWRNFGKKLEIEKEGEKMVAWERMNFEQFRRADDEDISERDKSRWARKKIETSTKNGGKIIENAHAESEVPEGRTKKNYTEMVWKTAH